MSSQSASGTPAKLAQVPAKGDGLPGSRAGGHQEGLGNCHWLCSAGTSSSLACMATAVDDHKPWFTMMRFVISPFWRSAQNGSPGAKVKVSAGPVPLEAAGEKQPLALSFIARDRWSVDINVTP